MRVDMTTSQLAGLMSIWTSGSRGSSPSAGTTGFGPATILSLGGSGPAAGGTYSLLGAIAGFGNRPSSGNGAGSTAAVQGLILQAAYSSPGASATTGFSQQPSAAERKSLEEAFDLMERGAMDEAESVVQGILSKNRNSGAATHALGLIEMSRGNYPEAEKHLRRAEFLAPGRGYGQDAENARLLAQSDDTVYQEALKLTGNPNTRERGVTLLLYLTERRPDHVDGRILLGESLLNTGDVINGLNQLFGAAAVADEDQLRRIETKAEDLVERMSNAPQVHRLLGRAQLRLGKYEQALAAFDQAASLAGTDAFTKADSAKAYVGIGRQFLERGDVSRALANFQRAGELDSGDVSVREALAEGYLARAESYRRYGNATQEIDSYRDAGRALGALGSKGLRTRIAQAAYTAGLRMERQNIALERELDKEVLAYQQAYDLDSDNTAYKNKLAETRNTIGDQFMADDKFAEAIGSYRRAYELYKNNQTYKSNLINAYRTYGDDLMSKYQYDKAVENYRNAYQLDVYDSTTKLKLAEAYNTRGLDYRTKEEYKKAALDFKEALRLYPDDPIYQANYDSVKAYDT